MSCQVLQMLQVLPDLELEFGVRWPKNRDFSQFDPQKMGIFDQQAAARWLDGRCHGCECSSLSPKLKGTWQKEGV